MDSLIQMYVGSASTLKMKGWYRGAWHTTMSRGSKWSATRFGFVLHQKDDEVLVELLQVDPNSPFYKPTVKPIPKDILREWAKGARLENHMVEVEGRLMISGLLYYIDGRPSNEMCESSNAYDAIDRYGQYLAEMLRWSGKVRTFADAVEVYDNLSEVQTFVDEMRPDGRLNSRIKRNQESIASEMRVIERLDKDQRQSLATWNGSKDYLERLGIEFDFKKET